MLKRRLLPKRLSLYTNPVFLGLGKNHYHYPHYYYHYSEYKHHKDKLPEEISHQISEQKTSFSEIYHIMTAATVFFQKGFFQFLKY